MDSIFGVGKCIWDTLMVLWQKSGESILSIYGVTRIAKSDDVVHMCAARTGRTVRPYSLGSHTCV
jgi:hypothetical protein